MSVEEPARRKSRRRRGPRARLGVAILAAATLAALAPSSASAAAGTGLSGGPSPAGAVPVEPGRYLDAISPGSERWYAIELAAGEALAVGGALFAPEDLDSESVEGSFALTVRSPSGREWVGSREVSPLFLTEGNGPETLGALTPPAGGPDPPVSESAAAFTETGTYAFGYALGGAGGGELDRDRELALELAIDRIDAGGGEPGGALAPAGLEAADEPAALEGAADPAMPTDEDEDGRATAPAPLAGGGSFNAAPLMEPGSYATTIGVGEDAYYAVEVPAGQRAQVAVEVDLTEGPGRRLERDLYSYLLAAYTPVFQPAGEDGELAEGGSVLVRTRTARASPIDELVGELGTGELSGPGAWYFRLYASEPFSGEGGGGAFELPAAIEVQLKGEALEPVAADPGVSELPPAEEAEGTGGLGFATIALVGAGALLVAVGVALTVGRRRRRRRARQI